MDETNEPIEPIEVITNPWRERKEKGFLNALVETIKLVLTKPRAFFNSIDAQAPIPESFLFYIIPNLTVFAVGIFLIGPQQRAMIEEAGNVVYIAALLSEFVGVFVLAAIFHLFVRLVKGTQNYTATFHVCAYAYGAVAVFSLLPLIGAMIGTVWGVIIIFIGFQCVHRLNPKRAFVAAASFYILMFLITGLQAVARQKLKSDVDEASQYLENQAPSRQEQPVEGWGGK